MAAKPFYADYVNRLMRWYCRAKEQGKEVNLESALDRENWNAVAKVMEKLNEENRCAIMKVYCKRDNIVDSVRLTAVELGWDQNKLWVLVSKVTRKVAEERRLV
jgi:predicted N-acetyltransferase YhbS